MDPANSQAEATYPLTLTGTEVALIRTALELLEATLGREEADELEEAQALLQKLPRVA